MPFKSLRKGPPTPLDLSSRERTSTSGPASAPYKHYQSGPPPSSSAPSLSHGPPSSPGSFKFWKRKTSASSSPTDASFPPTPPPHSSSSNNSARHHPSHSYASTSSTPLRTSTSNNLPDFHPQQSSRHASYAPPPSSSSSSSSSSYQPPHPSLYQQQQQYPSTSSPHRSVQLPPLSGSPSSRSALYFDEDYDWANGQPDFRPPPSSSGSSTYSNSSLPRNHTSTRPSPPGSWHSLPPRNSEIPLSAPLPPSRQAGGGGETGSPKVYVSTRRTGASSSVGGGAVGAGSHSGWGGAGVGVGPPRRESVGVPVGAAARMGHGRKRSRSMSNLPTLTSPVLMSRPAFDDSSVPLRSSSRRGPPPAFRSTVSTSSRPPPSRTNSPYSSTPSPTTPNFPPHHHLFGMGPPSVRSPLQLSGLPVVVVVPATPDTASVAGAGSRSSGGWGEAAMPPIPPSASVAVDLAKRMEEARSTPVVLVSTRPHSPQRALPSIEDAQAAAFIAQAAIDREGSITPTPSRPQPSFLDDDDSSPRKAAIRLPDIDIQELGLSFFNEDVVEPPSFDTPTLASSFSPSESSSSAVFVEDRSSTPPARIVSSRARSGSHPPLSSPPRVPLPARPVEEEEDESLEQEEEVVKEQQENSEEDAFGGEGSHGSMPSLSSSFSVGSTISASSSEADWSDTQDVDADSDGGEDVGGGLDEALSEMINSLSTTDTTSSGSPFTTRRESKVYSPSLTSDNTFLLQQPTSPSSSAAASLTPKANGNHPLPKSASNSSFVSTSSSILNSPSTAPWHEFPLPPPHTSASAPALSGLGLGIEPEDLLPPRKRQIPSPMLVRDHRRPFYLSASTGCLADKIGSWDETPTTSPTASTFSVIISPPPPPPSSPPPTHRSTVSASDIDLINFDSPSLNLSPVVAQETSFLSASSSSSSLASDASGESSSASSIFSAEDDLGTVSIAHVQTTESVRWAFARSGSATREVEGVAGWAM